jgi:nitrogen-specific signal transduction histidine kinase
MSSTLQQLAHELRQPLSVIETSAYCLELLLPDDDAAGHAHLARIRDQVECASRILNRIYEESRERTKSAISAVTY